MADTFKPPPSPSIVSMRELAPSPLDDSPINISRSDYFSSKSASASNSSKSPPSHLPPSSTSTTSSPGLFSHTPTFYLLRLQRYSSYTLSLFLTAHITNTSLIPLLTQSVSASEPYLLLTRPYYQSTLFEPLIILAPLAIHIGSGIALRLYRRRKQIQVSGAETRAERKGLKWPRFSGTSILGYALWPLLAAHVMVNRVAPLMVEGDSTGVGLGYVSHGFAKHPILAFGAYVALVGVGCWHFTWGTATWLGLTPEMAKGADAVERGLGRKRRWYGVNGVAMLLTGLWMAGGLGVVGRGGEARGWVGRNYDKIFEGVPLVGRWLAS